MLFLPYQTSQLFPVHLVHRETIFLDPGHGGKDNGACVHDVVEDSINLAIASALFEHLQKENYVTYLTRSEDYDLASLYASNRKREDLKKRVETINRLRPSIFLSIHLNAYSGSTNVKGVMVYYRPKDEKSKLLAETMQNQFNQELKQDKKTHAGDFYLLTRTFVPGIFIECGFLSNAEERNALIQPTYQAALAMMIFRGIEQYFRLLKST